MSIRLIYQFMDWVEIAEDGLRLKQNTPNDIRDAFEAWKREKQIDS